MRRPSPPPRPAPPPALLRRPPSHAAAPRAAGIEPRAAFNALDLNRDGKVDRAEFKHLAPLLTDLPKMHELGMTEPTFAKRHARGDTAEESARAFARADHDGNGRISMKEYQHFQESKEL